MDWVGYLLALGITLGGLILVLATACLWDGTWVIREGVVVQKLQQGSHYYLVVQVTEATGKPENLRVEVNPDVYAEKQIQDTVTIRHKIVDMGDFGEAECTEPVLLPQG